MKEEGGRRSEMALSIVISLEIKKDKKEADDCHKTEHNAPSDDSDTSLCHH